ncbi:MAG TPA: TIGR03619 family F420-dependent LLM class oxidoreductase [Candidatus Binatia bacterium]|nr:TIGR03619 family F420-dependent LLM class oxidoreductase [Candidatus Binatia bacterium]
MRYGIITPVIIANPRVVNEWERDASVDELAAIARAADRLGYFHLTASNHVAIPRSAAARRGRRYWDPAVTLGYVAAITRRIRLATYVLVLGYYHPLEIVKRYGTLDAISRGRLILGVGVGSLEEEFRLLGRDFAGRGPLARDAIRAVEASFGKREPEYHGPAYDFAGFTIDPTSVQERVPIWIGGRTARSLRTAVELDCEAWVPFALEPEQVRDVLGRARASEAWSRRTRTLDVGLAPEPPLDPIADSGRVRAEIERHAACGATMLNLRFRSRSLAHHLEQMEAFVSVAGPSD